MNELKSKNISRLIKMADKGRSFWKDLHQAEDEYVLLLPDQDEEVNSACRDAFHEMLEKTNSSGRIFSVSNGSILREDAENLLQLYSMYRFTDKLIIGSLDKPYGRKIRNLLVLEGMNLKKAIRAVLFGLGEN